MPSPASAGERARAAFHGPGDQDRCQNVGRAYRPALTVADQVMAFHQECRHPGCSRRAQRCDLDHLTEWPAGPSCQCNLLPLCRFHHRLRTHGGWRARFTQPGEPFPLGTVEWVSRLGARYYDVPGLHFLDAGSGRRRGAGRRRPGPETS